MTFILKILIGILNLIFSLFKLLPVKNKIVFISRQSNNKSEDMCLLEETIKRQDTSVELVFLCKKIGNTLSSKIGYCFHIIRQMYHIATAKVVVLDSYCPAISVLNQRKSLIVIQMWHALGALKKFGLSIVGEGEGRNSNIAEALNMHKHYTYILASGKPCIEPFAQAFGYDKSRVKVMSLPRVDKLTSKVTKEELLREIYAEYPEFKDKKVIVYAPTFRKDRDISKEISNIAKEFDKSKYVFVLKKHPLMEVSCNDVIVDQKFTTIDMLFVADYVICDYSAVVFEAAILKKPLFFYTFDYQEYGANRDFYIDYINEMPGVISDDSKVLAQAITTDKYDLSKVSEFAHKYVERQSQCTKTLADFILSWTQPHQ
jgi:CDP-ribitol ribitolphosphotransferase